MPSAPVAQRTTSRRPIGKRVWSAGRLLVLGGALLLTYGIFFMASLRVATRARDVRVPNVTGKSVTEASASIAGAGLSVGVDPVRRPDPKVPADHVISQDPPAGTIVRRPRSIRVRVSDGPRVATIPMLTGMSERAAEIALTQDRIEISAKAEVRTTDYEPGEVIAQVPPAKSRASSVALLVNRAEGALPYVMPDVIGAPGLRTADVLRKQGFTVAIVGESPYPGLPAGIVIHQTPQAGFQVTKREPISLEISK